MPLDPCDTHDCMGVALLPTRTSQKPPRIAAPRARASNLGPRSAHFRGRLGQEMAWWYALSEIQALNGQMCACAFALGACDLNLARRKKGMVVGSRKTLPLGALAARCSRVHETWMVSDGVHRMRSRRSVMSRRKMWRFRARSYLWSLIAIGSARRRTTLQHGTVSATLGAVRLPGVS